ncbi:hypothetical protein AALO_G00066960 [Alosa alosa]|uniref:Uncharacterized protein n=1 Tax=Alosa alosa TaxID=278164 RepID=A0AAV6H4N7_9TELE|nr:hypothetical protein AALO_G00066960 [Alosa alosa]
MYRYNKLILVAVPAYALYAICSNLYKSFRRNKCVVFESKKTLPCYLYLYGRYKIQSFRKRKGQLYPHRHKTVNPTFTILNCSLEVDDVRWYCWAAGYGWDYPDSVFRDIPLCFCDVLCCRLLAMVISSDDFRLNPQGADAVRAPLSVSVQFKQPLVLPRKVIFHFWQATDESCQLPVCRFQLQDCRGTSYILGDIIKEPG